MKRWLLVGLALFALVLVVGFVLTLVPRLRADAAAVECRNNLREVGLFAGRHADPSLDRSKVWDQIPAGTVVNPALAAEDRLSWYVAVLPGLDQKRQQTGGVLAGIDRAQGWAADANRAAAETKLVVLQCPGRPPEVVANQAAPTSYVGVGGLGRDAAAQPPGPRSGCFRYDAATPFAAITDGLSQTLLLGERSADVGPWLRGGPATVVGLDDAAGSLPLQGPGGQFGGCHPHGANWAFADGSVRFLTDRVDPKVLDGLATAAGRETDTPPGES